MDPAAVFLRTNGPVLLALHPVLDNESEAHDHFKRNAYANFYVPDIGKLDTVPYDGEAKGREVNNNLTEYWRKRLDPGCTQPIEISALIRDLNGRDKSSIIEGVLKGSIVVEVAIATHRVRAINILTQTEGYSKKFDGFLYLYHEPTMALLAHAIQRSNQGNEKRHNAPPLSLPDAIRAYRFNAVLAYRSIGNLPVNGVTKITDEDIIACRGATGRNRQLTNYSRLLTEVNKRSFGCTNTNYVNKCGHLKCLGLMSNDHLEVFTRFYHHIKSELKHIDNDVGYPVDYPAAVKPGPFQAKFGATWDLHVLNMGMEMVRRALQAPTALEGYQIFERYRSPSRAPLAAPQPVMQVVAVVSGSVQPVSVGPSPPSVPQIAMGSESAGAHQPQPRPSSQSVVQQAAVNPGIPANSVPPVVPMDLDQPPPGEQRRQLRPRNIDGGVAIQSARSPRRLQSPPDVVVLPRLKGAYFGVDICRILRRLKLQNRVQLLHEEETEAMDRVMRNTVHLAHLDGLPIHEELNHEAQDEEMDVEA